MAIARLTSRRREMTKIEMTKVLTDLKAEIIKACDPAIKEYTERCWTDPCSPSSPVRLLRDLRHIAVM